MNQILTFLKEAFLRCLFSHLSTYIHIFLLWHFHSIQPDLTQFFPDSWPASRYSFEISIIITRYPSFFPLIAFPLQFADIGLTTFSNIGFFSSAFFLLSLRCPYSACPYPCLSVLRGQGLPLSMSTLSSVNPTPCLDIKQSNSLHLFSI